MAGPRPYTYTPPHQHSTVRKQTAVVMPRHGSSRSSLSASRNPLRFSMIPEILKWAKERDDDDIVEIMKVCRREGMPDVTEVQLKTLCSQAAQALRSIKNVGKAPCRPIEHVVSKPSRRERPNGHLHLRKRHATNCGEVCQGPACSYLIERAFRGPCPTFLVLALVAKPLHQQKCKNNVRGLDSLPRATSLARHPDLGTSISVLGETLQWGQ